MFFRKFCFWLFWSLLGLLIIQSLHFSQSITILKPQVYFLDDNANVSANKLHTMQILDNDIKNIVSVKKFGAKGNGVNDDTKAIQTAIDTVYQQGGGVILFPEGVYIVTSVILKDNITYQGYGATIKRPDKQGKWTRTFTTNYSSQKNSQPLIIQGFTFDGNSQNQGHYKKYELEQAHLIFLTADPELPGKWGC